MGCCCEKIWRDLLPKDAVANMKLDAASFTATIEAADKPLAGAAIAAMANDDLDKDLGCQSRCCKHNSGTASKVGRRKYTLTELHEEDCTPEVQYERADQRICVVQEALL